VTVRETGYVHSFTIESHDEEDTVDALKRKGIFYDIWRSEGIVFFTIIPPSPTLGRWRVQPPTQCVSEGSSVK
jgi:hypothetical protein